MAPPPLALTRRLAVSEVFGLHPWPERLRQARLALGGDPYTPRSTFGLSSLRIFKPWISLPLWFGRDRPDGRVRVYNLYNHTPTPVEEGWSVRVRQVRDFRGGRLTYDSHNGTDFAVPVGTVVVAPAPGRVTRVSTEFHRGGLKVVIDHGGGLFTTSNHLARTWLSAGDIVRRGEPIALSGSSGLDGFTMCPWVAPHVHFNTWLGGRAVDPFGGEGEVSLWRGGLAVGPAVVDPDEPIPPQTTFDADAVAATIAGCRDPALRDQLTDGPDVLFHSIYFPTRFRDRPPLVAEPAPRREILDLPFGRYRGLAW